MRELLKVIIKYNNKKITEEFSANIHDDILTDWKKRDILRKMANLHPKEWQEVKQERARVGIYNAQGWLLYDNLRGAWIFAETPPREFIHYTEYGEIGEE